VKKERMKNGRRKREKNVFCCLYLVVMKRERKENGVKEGDPSRPTIHFPFNFEKKREMKMTLRRTLQNYPPLLYYIFI
jgi:hypothetical protein